MKTKPKGIDHFTIRVAMVRKYIDMQHNIYDRIHCKDKIVFSILKRHLETRVVFENFHTDNSSYISLMVQVISR